MPEELTDVLVVRARVDAGDGPVEGLRVELYETEAGEILAGEWTDAEGRAELAIGVDPEAPPSPIEVRASDRWGEIVWRGPDPNPAAPGEMEVEGLVDDERLQRHRAVPTTWPAYQDGLVPDAHLVEIRDAIDLVAASPAEHARMSTWAKCLPEMLRERDLTSMAKGVIDAHPAEAERFRRLMRTLSPTRPASPMGHGREGADVAVPAPEMRSVVAHGASPCGCDESGPLPWRGELHPLGDDGFIPADRITPVRIAALLAGETAAEGERFLGGVERFLAEIEPYREIWATAREILQGRGSVPHFRSALARWGGRCGPDDNPLWPWQWRPPVREPRERPDPSPIPPSGGGIPEPFEPEPFCDPRQDRGAIEEQRARRLYYEFTRFTPTRVCPGASVLIEGKGFVTYREVVVYGKDASGNTVVKGTRRLQDAPGRVVFPTRGGEATVQVGAWDWHDTKITVKTPPDLVTGQPYLLLGDRKMVICHRFANLRRPTRANARTLYSGHARLRGFEVKGLSDGRVQPGQPLAVRWWVDANPAMTVRLISFELPNGNKKTEASWTGMSQGSKSVTLPSTRTARFKLRLEASTPAPCPSTSTDEVEVLVARDPTPKIDGIEVTQAIQHYKSGKHLADKGDFGPDNSIPLVDGKRALVRVYVRSGQAADFDRGRVDLEGELEVQRRLGTPRVETKKLKPINQKGICTAFRNPTYATERGDLDMTLNFLVPADWVVAKMHLAVEVRPSEPAYASRRARDSLILATVGRRVTRIQPYLVTTEIGKGSAATVRTPTREQYFDMLAFMRSIYPFTAIRRAAWRTYRWKEETLSPSALLARINGLFMLDGSPLYIVYGAITGHSHRGMQALGSFVANKNNRRKFSHEAGHWFSFYHTDTGIEPLPRSAGYPGYKPHPQGSIGEYGWGLHQGHLNTRTELKRPATFRDIMSYRRRRWVSPGRYRDVLSHHWVYKPPSEGAPEPRPETRLVSGVYLHGELRHLRSLIGPAPAQDYARVDSGLTLETHRRGEIRSVPLRGTPASDYDEGALWFLLTVEPDVEAIEIRDGERVLGRLAPRAAPPTVETVSLHLGDEEAHVAWAASGDELTYAVQYSSDDGETWMTLEDGLGEPELVVPLSDLPGGAACRLRVLAMDGFDLARGDSESFWRPRLPPEAVILAPADGTSPVGSHGILLLGDGSSQEGSLHDHALEWSSDVDGLLGQGEEVFTQDLSEGAHVITLRATDREGKVAEASISIDVRPEEDGPREGPAQAEDAASENAGERTAEPD